MTITADRWTPQRDRWGRPLIPQPSGKPVAYTRATTVAKTLDDEAALAKWAQRMTAAGLVRRPDLLALIAARLTPAGDIPEDAKTDVQRWCDDAKEAAAASAAANMGTALHAMTEALDRGDPLGNVPGDLQADLDAYQRETAGLRHLAIEQFVILDEYQVGGTFDRLSQLPDGRVVIADIKTGRDLAYSWRSIAVQLAIYAHGVTFDGVERRPLPADIDRTTGIVIHLPVGATYCTLYEVDLEAGWEAFQHSMWARGWRNRKNLHRPLTLSTAPAPAPVATPDPRRAVILARLDQLTDPQRELVRQRWTWAVKPRDLSDDDLPALIALLDDVARDTNADFTDTELYNPYAIKSLDITPARRRMVEADILAARPWQPPDDGGPIDPQSADTLRAKVRALPPEQQAWIKARIGEAKAAGRPITGNDTMRWFAIGRALLFAAPCVVDTWQHDDDMARLVLAGAMGDEAVLQPTIELGQAFGSLSIDQANAAADRFDACRADANLPPCDWCPDTGAPTLN